MDELSANFGKTLNVDEDLERYSESAGERGCRIFQSRYKLLQQYDFVQTRVGCM